MKVKLELTTAESLLMFQLLTSYEAENEVDKQLTETIMSKINDSARAALKERK